MFTKQTYICAHVLVCLVDIAVDLLHDGAFRGSGLATREEVCRRFGVLLSRRRGEANISQAALAKAVGLSRTSITNIERGRQPVNINTLYSMADILGVEVGD